MVVSPSYMEEDIHITDLDEHIHLRAEHQNFIGYYLQLNMV